MKKIISIILCTLMAVSLFSGINTVKANADTSDLMYPEAPLYLNDIDGEYLGFQKAAETELLAMYFIDSTVNMAILNKKTGMIWSSLVKDSFLDEHGEDKSAGRFHSIISVGDIGLVHGTSLTEKFVNQVLTTEGKDTGGGENGYMKVDYAAVPNGVRVTAWYSDTKYKIVIDFQLDPIKNTLEVHCDTNEFLYQSDRSKWITLNILPYFGAAGDYDNGYVFLPDGSGTIAEFTPHHSSVESSKTIPFFSQELTSTLQLDLNEQNGIMPALYPVLGMKRNNDAFFAIITEGQEYSGVKFAPSGNITKLYRVHPVFYLGDLRALANGDLSELTYQYEGDIFEKNYHVEYHFLSDDDANYSGMARTYREYLLDNGMLNDAIEDGATMPLALELPMNTYESNIFGDKIVTMSTFSQATDIVRDLYEKGIDDMMVNVSMWQSRGLAWNAVTTAPTEIGGKNGFKNFVEEVKNLGYDVFAEVDMVRAGYDTTKFKATRDAAKNRNGIAFAGSYHLIAPPVIQTRYDDIYEPYMKELGISGMNFQMLGYYVFYYHYAETKYSKSNTVEIYQSILENADKDFEKTSVWYGNEYTLNTADWIYDLPSTDTGYAGTTQTVPFAQLVLHGYIPYSAIAGNTFYDDAAQTLTWIEYGYIPYYKITYEATDKLLETPMSILFSAKYTDWSETIVEKYNKLTDSIGYLYSIPMKEHQRLAENTYLTVYEDGSKVYVNYDIREFELEDGTVIPPKDYIVVKG